MKSDVDLLSQKSVSSGNGTHVYRVGEEEEEAELWREMAFALESSKVTVEFRPDPSLWQEET